MVAAQSPAIPQGAFVEAVAKSTDLVGLKQQGVPGSVLSRGLGQMGEWPTLWHFCGMTTTIDN